jgi:hypothetical protein
MGKQTPDQRANRISAPGDHPVDGLNTTDEVVGCQTLSGGYGWDVPQNNRRADSKKRQSCRDQAGRGSERQVS